jgi:hypothetical protein
MRFPASRARTAAPLILLALSLATLALPACSRKHRATGVSNQRPTGHLVTNRSSGPTPLTVSFAGISEDVDGTIVDVLIDYGDGGSIAGPLGSHVYASAGTYFPTFHAVDDQGAYAHVVDTITVGVTNRSPNLSIALGGSAVAPGSIVALSSSASDPDGNGVVFQWEQLTGPAAVITNPKIAATTATLPAGVSGTFVFRVTASDNGSPISSAQGTVTHTSRVTWTNTTSTIFANRCNSCHFNGNSQGIPSWQSYTTVFNSRALIRTRISPGGNMRGYLVGNEPDILIDWIDDGAP